MNQLQTTLDRELCDTRHRERVVTSFVGFGRWLHVKTGLLGRRPEPEVGFPDFFPGNGLSTVTGQLAENADHRTSVHMIATIDRPVVADGILNLAPYDPGQQGYLFKKLTYNNNSTIVIAGSDAIGGIRAFTSEVHCKGH